MRKPLASERLKTQGKRNATTSPPSHTARARSVHASGQAAPASPVSKPCEPERRARYFTARRANKRHAIRVWRSGKARSARAPEVSGAQPYRARPARSRARLVLIISASLRSLARPRAALCGFARLRAALRGSDKDLLSASRVTQPPAASRMRRACTRRAPTRRARTRRARES